jgi:hypothetical protein
MKRAIVIQITAGDYAAATCEFDELERAFYRALLNAGLNRITTADFYIGIACAQIEIGNDSWRCDFDAEQREFFIKASEHELQVPASIKLKFRKVKCED